ncbi:hypothetical protein ACFVAF_25385 [Streptomyces sp. NPDC057596]|uniref:hypothetical protein n=1 Tax=Streptomyces sp. NPDC057596 TaxID=3346178 RepID=UPI0036BF05DC
MRFLACLNRQYTIRQSAVLLLPSLVVLLLVQGVASGVGVGPSAASLAAVVAALAVFFVIAAVIDRRTPTN